MLAFLVLQKKAWGPIAAALDERDSSLRARVLARLAAATQPAEDPDEPMALARPPARRTLRGPSRSKLNHLRPLLNHASDSGAF